MRDVIVIFGAALRPDGTPSGTLRRRVEAAYLTGTALPGVLYLATGGAGRAGPSEASAMRGLLLQLGVPPQDVLIEERSGDTFASVVACRRILSARADVGRVRVCTSRLHLLRCRLLFRLAGQRTVPVAIAGERGNLGTAAWLWHVLHEAAALPYDAALMLVRNAAETAKLTIK